MPSSSYDFSVLTPYLSAIKEYNIFKSVYKDLRFHVQMGSYITIDSKYEANLPGLAFDTYGDVSLWKAILYANGLADPINDIIVGARLGLPEAGSLLAFLTRQSAFPKTTVI